MDFNLNNIVDNWHPFKRDIQFEILDNGNYVISYRNVADYLTDLVVLDPSFKLLFPINLDNIEWKFVGIYRLKLFKYKNKIIVSFQNPLRFSYSKLVLINLENPTSFSKMDIQTLQFQTSIFNETIYLTCDQKYIYCLEEKYPKIHVISWQSLSEVATYSTSTQEHLPYFIPKGSKVEQIEFVDNKFVFRHEDKMKIFENGKILLNAINVESISINHGTNQIVLWDQTKKQLTYLNSNGNVLCVKENISLENCQNCKLKVYFDKLNNPFFVDLEHAFLYKLTSGKLCLLDFKPLKQK